MPNPVPSDVHVNAPLTDISVAYVQDINTYIAGGVFKNLPVDKQSNVYYKYNKGDWFRTDAQRRAPGTPSISTNYNVSTDNYFADVWAVHADIDDQLRANADSPFRLDAEAARLVANNLYLRRDKEWIARYFQTSVWDTNITGVGTGPTANQVLQWDKSGSTPIEDMYLQRMSILEKTGIEPNTLVIGARVWQILANHAEVIERVKYTQAGFLTEELVARAFGVDNILVARAVENTAIENKSLTPTMSFMAGKAAFLCYSNPNPSLMAPSAGYTFSWNGYLGASQEGLRVKRYRVEDISSDRVEAEMAFALKIVATDLGCFFSTVVS